MEIPVTDEEEEYFRNLPWWQLASQSAVEIRQHGNERASASVHASCSAAGARSAESTRNKHIVADGKSANNAITGSEYETIKLERKDVVIGFLTNIARCQEHVRALNGIVHFIREFLPHEQHEAGIYHELLMRIEIEQWRKWMGNS